MERKHQVFVSSSYRDLIEERRHVIHALLELDCIPAGMELFPATDEDAWSLIKEVIDDCDYYILILAGKYGSLNPEGLGYTEREYDYAVSVDKPVISFLHANIDDLPTSKTEKTEELQDKLISFRKKVHSKHCKYWTTPEDLGGKVSRSLVQLRKKHPSPGWIPGRYAADEKMFRHMEEMRERILQLENEALAGRDQPPPGTEDLEQGEDMYNLLPTLKINAEGKTKEVPLSASWDAIFSYAGSTLIGECNEVQLGEKLKLVFWHQVPEKLAKLNSYARIVIPYVVFDQIKIQLQALGLMTSGTKKRAVSDSNVYWKLTRYGEKYLIKIRSIRKTKPKDTKQATATDKD